MKRVIVVVVAAALVLGWGARPAAAGSRVHHRWEGAAIALGAIGLLAVIGDVVQAQPVAVSVGGWYPAYPDPAYCPPPPLPPPPPPPRRYAPGPPPGRVWVPGQWVDVQVWVPAATYAPSWDDDCRDRDDRHRGYRKHRRHDRDGCGSGDHLARQTRGTYERRRVWREGYYR